MPPRKSKPDASPRVGIIRPSWADALFVRATQEPARETVQLVSAAVQLIAKANPKRIALGLSRQVTSATACFVAPHNNPVLFGSTLTFDPFAFWLTIFTHGPFVQGEWYAAGGAGEFVQVLEVQIL
jgi:hypothetical protein